MSDPLQIDAHEHGVLRVFALADDAPHHGDLDAETAGAMLGARHLDAGKIEVLKPEALGDMSLADYMIEGYGVDPSELDSDREMLDAITTPVVLVRSSAFGGQEQAIAPGGGLSLIGRYRESPQAPHEVMAAAASEGVSASAVAPPPDPEAARTPRGFIIAGALIIAAILIALVAF